MDNGERVGLVLSRYVGQRIVIDCGDGRTVILKVIDIRDEAAKVRLGFKADPSVCIHREEVWERIQADQAHLFEGTT